MKQVSFLMNERNAENIDKFMRQNTGINNRSGAINHIINMHFEKPEETTVLLNRINEMDEKLSQKLREINNASYQALERILKMHLVFSHTVEKNSGLSIPDDLLKKLNDIYYTEEVQNIVEKRLGIIKEL